MGSGPGGGILMPVNAATAAADANHAGLTGIHNYTTTDTASCSASVYDWPAADSPAPADDPEEAAAKSPRQLDGGGGGRKSLSDSVKRRIRQLYRTFSRHGAGSGGGGGSCADTELSVEAAAAAAVAAAVAAAEPPSPRARPPPVKVKDSSRQQQQAQQVPSGAVNLNNNSDQKRRSFQRHLDGVGPLPRLNASLSNSNLKEVNPIVVPLDSRLSSSTTGVASGSRPPAGSEGGTNKEDDLYTVLTVDAEELKNFYTGIFVVAECEGKTIKTARSNRLEDIQTSFLFYRRSPTKNPINFKMFANHLTLGRRVLIGELNLTLQPGEPFDGMSVRRSIRERPELRADGGSGLLFNFLTGTHHTQHLSGV